MRRYPVYALIRPCAGPVVGSRSAFVGSRWHLQRTCRDIDFEDDGLDPWDRDEFAEPSEGPCDFKEDIMGPPEEFFTTCHRHIPTRSPQPWRRQICVEVSNVPARSLRPSRSSPSWKRRIVRQSGKRTRSPPPRSSAHSLRQSSQSKKRFDDCLRTRACHGTCVCHSQVKKTRDQVKLKVGERLCVTRLLLQARRVTKV